MAPLEPWEKVLVDNAAFSQTDHGELTCIECHAGVNTDKKDAAHEGLIVNPSAQPQEFCGECHEEQVTAYPNSLHNTQAGYWTAINARSGDLPENHPALEEMFGNHCATCHTTCGECHVSQPDNVGGGLFNGHVFEKTPPMTRSCTACHGSRVGNEFLGKNENLPGDVHFREARMNCVKCHEGADLHGTADASAAPEHRLSGAEDPTCIECHQDAFGDNAIEMHQQHGDSLSCQVCHSVTYTSCDGCHVALSETSGKPFFETEATYSTFLIGRNPIQSDDRPYKFVPVRHVPASPTSYEFYGENLLPNFDTTSTWVYATPHNIQRSTPQNASCEACHGNPDLFMTADKVSAEEQTANANVIVTDLPLSWEEILAIPTLPVGHEEHIGKECKLCHDTGVKDAPVSPEDHVDYADDTCTKCHKVSKQ
ncbi:MAG TPA: cytochrome c3 family protein [Anaerolineales bacterium]|nr:cytochrome c3 family protein [Anaerolineales bacterium]